jgi:hypothetical protein
MYVICDKEVHIQVYLTSERNAGKTFAIDHDRLTIIPIYFSVSFRHFSYKFKALFGSINSSKWLWTF